MIETGALHFRRFGSALAITTMVAACGTATPLSPSSSAAPASTSAASAPSATPIVGRAQARNFPVAADGRELALLYEGAGSPTVLLEDGHPSETGGIRRFSTGRLWAELTRHTRVCAYDRAGYGNSDSARDEPRDADDVVNDLQALLATAGEQGPYVLVGSSFGGMIVTYFAARDPNDVAGVVLLDVPAPTDTLTLEELPELAWDHPANPEHVDVIPEFETRFARDPQPMQAPLTVITAANGQSDVADQAFWLELSPDATQVELEGGHDLDQDDPTGVSTEILELVDGR